MTQHQAHAQDVGPHCWHEDDGTVHQRHSGRPREGCHVTCCWCGLGRMLSMYGNNDAGQLLDVPHGEFRP